MSILESTASSHHKLSSSHIIIVIVILSVGTPLAFKTIGAIPKDILVAVIKIVVHDVSDQLVRSLHVVDTVPQIVILWRFLFSSLLLFLNLPLSAFFGKLLIFRILRNFVKIKGIFWILQIDIGPLLGLPLLFISISASLSFQNLSLHFLKLILSWFELVFI